MIKKSEKTEKEEKKPKTKKFTMINKFVEQGKLPMVQDKALEEVLKITDFD